ncbi:MAG: hypothetical protein CMM15_10615 [Rhodospirillaceae bacterium]|nr:hypothetical protein [Rhodospirillaceae bacterium]OUX68020.1 MAG: hypothetical protein CBD38_00950 [bacterium TMED178]|tara:strand:+ start:10522 stop:11064 length:543 start_codon:yes stop_codon:yes gene_type:complete
MKIFPKFFPLFLVANPIEKMTELRSSLTPILPRLVERFQGGLGLDVNCYTGDSTCRLQSLFPDLQVVGIDKNQSAINAARQKYSHTFFSCRDIEKGAEAMEHNLQVIQISEYVNIQRMLENTYPLLDDEGMIILRYRDEDFPYIQSLLRKNFEFPLRNRKGFLLANMYLWENEKTVIIFK